MPRGIRLAPPVLAIAAALACGVEPSRELPAARLDGVAVKQDAARRETHYTIASGDCTISWTVYGGTANRGVIRHRSDCGLALVDQAPLIGILLRKTMESGFASEFRTLDWGRLYPDRARDATMAARLSLAAKRSAEWDPTRGEPRGGDLNGWVRKLVNQSQIHGEVRAVFRESGLDIQAAAVEKVLVLPAGELEFFGRLRPAGVREQDRVPFDCQLWFSVRPEGFAGRVEGRVSDRGLLPAGGAAK